MPRRRGAERLSARRIRICIALAGGSSNAPIPVTKAADDVSRKHPGCPARQSGQRVARLSIRQLSTGAASKFDQRCRISQHHSATSPTVRRCSTCRRLQSSGRRPPNTRARSSSRCVASMRAVTGRRREAQGSGHRGGSGRTPPVGEATQASVRLVPSGGRADRERASLRQFQPPGSGAR